MIIEQEILSSDYKMCIISASSTDTEDKYNMEDEESNGEVLLSNVTPYKDEPLGEADQIEGEDEGSGSTLVKT